MKNNQKISQENVVEIYPLTSLQKGMLYHYVSNLDSRYYYEQLSIRVRGFIDPFYFKKAWEYVLKSNEILKSVFRWKGLSQPVQIVLKEFMLPINQFDLSNESNALEQLEIIKDNDRTTFIDIGNAAMRVTLCKLSDKACEIIISHHHILYDGWSNGIIINELFNAYTSFFHHENIPIKCKRKYSEYIQKELYNTKEAEKYWNDYLKDYHSNVILPTDHRKTHENTDASHIELSIGNELVDKVKMYSKQNQVSLVSVLYCAWALLLQQYSESNDVVFGTTVSGRVPSIGGIDDLVGMFINTLPMRVKMDHEICLNDLLKQINGDLIHRRDFELYPMIEIKKLQQVAKLDSLFDTLVVIENYPLQLSEKTYGSFALDSYSIFEMTNYDITLIIQMFEGIKIYMNYNSEIFDKETVDTILNQYIKLIELIVEYPKQKVSELNQLTKIEHRKKDATQIRICSTFTADNLCTYIESWANIMDLNLNIKVAPYNQVFQSILNPSSILNEVAGINIYFIRFEDYIRDASNLSEVEMSEKLTSIYNEIVHILNIRTHYHPEVFVIMPISQYQHISLGVIKCLEDLYEQWKDQVTKMQNKFVLDLKKVDQEYSIQQVFDYLQDREGHIPYSEEIYAAVGTEVFRFIKALKSAPFKCIILDCDNTLWHGVCAEEGSLGVKVEEPYKYLQKFMIHQYNSGVLLALCSKNNEEDVWDVFDHNPDMLLKKEHFITYKINWNSKSSNIYEIAQELNLNTNSFIFIDDSYAVCSEVMQECKEVLTLPLPRNEAYIPAFLKHIWAFDHVVVTNEDLIRNKLYKAEKSRQIEQQSLVSIDDFIRSLEMKVFIIDLTQDEVTRCAQLLQRTNQFNLNGVIWKEDEIRNLLVDDKKDCWVIHAKDRFGNYGMVGVVITEQTQDALLVLSFSLSCRILGRGVEIVILDHLRKYAIQKKLDQLYFKYIDTKRNTALHNFMERYINLSSNKFCCNVKELQLDLCQVDVFVGQQYEQLDTQKEMVEQQEKFYSQDIGNHTIENEVEHDFFNDIQLMDVTTLLHKKQYLTLQYTTGKQLLKLNKTKKRLQKMGDTPFFIPETYLEERLNLIWKELLGLSKIGTRDNFFELGGDSLLLMSLISRIYKEFQVEVPLSEMFKRPTIKELAMYTLTSRIE